MSKMQRCACECGCKERTTHHYCVSCEWDRLDAASGMFLSRPGVKKHLKYVKGKKVISIGPLLVVDD